MEDYDEDQERASADVEMVLAAFPDEATAESLSNRSFSLTLKLPTKRNTEATICMCLPPGYPSKTPLLVETWFGADAVSDRASMQRALRDIRKVSDDSRGMECALDACAAALRAWEDSGAEEDPEDGGGAGAASMTAERQAERQDAAANAEALERCEWRSGPKHSEKKSTFQAHIAKVSSEAEFKAALEVVLGSSTKIQRASHNMWAYRFRVSGIPPKEGVLTQIGVLKHDNDDDGEDGAGSKMAHLLHMMDVDGALVVVSRWFGGTLLGPRRFAIINNVAREFIIECREDDFIK